MKPRTRFVVKLLTTWLAFLLIACSVAGKPSVVIMSPPSGSQFFEGEDIAVQSSASDSAGVVRVELVVDGNIARVDPSPTAQGQSNFTLIQTWKATAGVHTIIVRAYNTAGAVSDPSGISVNVLQRIAQAPPSTPTIPGAPPPSLTITPSPKPPTITPSPVPQAPGPSSCTNTAVFVQDVTVPDGTPWAPGQAFNKIWQVRNTGTCTWSGYQLVFASGEAMTTNTTVAVPTAAPGATADILVPMTAPTALGIHAGQWRLRSSTGLFGPTLSVSINVTSGGCGGLPNIASFTASTPSIPAASSITVSSGTAVTLSWGAVTNADSAELDQGIGGVETPGSRTVNPTATTVYTLTARCGANTRIAQVTVVVTAPPVVLLPSTSQVLGQSSIPAGSTGSASVACPSGSVVTGGGYASSSSLDVHNSSKYGNGWQVYAKNNGGSSALLNAYAVCLANTSGTTSQVTVQVTIPTGGTGPGTATCPGGSVLTGGGFALNTGEEVYTQSKTGNAWQAYGYNSTGSGLLLNVYAICLSGTSATTVQAPVVQVSVPAGSTGTAVATCSSGVATAGGFASSSGLSTKVYTQSKTSDQGWQVFLQNGTGSSQLLNAYVICASF